MIFENSRFSPFTFRIIFHRAKLRGMWARPKIGDTRVRVFIIVKVLTTRGQQVFTLLNRYVEFA